LADDAADDPDRSSAGDGDCAILDVDVTVTHSYSAVFAWLFRLVGLSTVSLQYFLKFTDSTAKSA